MITPFAFLAEVRKFFAGPIVLAGGISTGADIAAAIAMGADFAYVGTRFIAARESLASDSYKQMLVDSGVDDLVLTALLHRSPRQLPQDQCRAGRY